MITDHDTIVARARSLLGTPFIHQGRTASGIDCIGLLAYALDYRGKMPAYPRDPVNGELERELERIFGPPVVTADRRNPLRTTAGLQRCDILSIQYKGPIRHVAMVVEHVAIPNQLSIIHTDSNVERVTECILDQYWLNKIVKVWRP